MAIGLVDGQTLGGFARKLGIGVLKPQIINPLTPLNLGGRRYSKELKDLLHMFDVVVHVVLRHRTNKHG